MSKALTMIEYDKSKMPDLQGDPPNEIWWKGRQWAVTASGIEALDGTYYVDAGRLGEDIPEWSWIRQLGEKEWVDVADFTTAFLVAHVLHGHAAPDRDLILKHYADALDDQA